MNESRFSSGLRFVRHPVFVALVCIVVVLFVSILPWNRIMLGTRSQAGASPSMAERARTVHYAVHAVGYSLMTCFGWFLSGPSRPGGRFTAFLIVCGLGYMTEYLQHVTNHMMLEYYDVLTNIGASVLTFLILHLVPRRD